MNSLTMIFIGILIGFCFTALGFIVIGSIRKSSLIKRVYDRIGFVRRIEATEDVDDHHHPEYWRGYQVALSWAQATIRLGR